MNTVYAATSTAADQVAGGTASELANLFEKFIISIPLWIAAFVVILISFVLAKIVRSVVESKLADSGLEEEHKEVQALAGRISYLVIMTLGGTIGLKIAGIDLTTIIAAVGFGIGFALKDIIMNFIAGVMIIVSRHFTTGDFIKVGGVLGKIIEIQSRVTILQAIDGTKVIVPNASLFSGNVISYTSNPFRRIEVLVGIDYRNSLENAAKICMAALKKTKGILAQPKPTVVIAGFNASSMDLKVRGWVESRSAWLKIKGNLTINIKKEFDKYGINIPWPITTLAYDKDSEIVEKIMEEEKVNESILKGNLSTVITSQTPLTQATVPVVDDEEKPLKPLGEIR